MQCQVELRDKSREEQKCELMIDWLIDFNGISTHPKVILRFDLRKTHSFYDHVNNFCIVVL